MDIFDAARVLVRWWFVTVPVLLAALIATAALSTNVQPEYRATGTVAIAGPKVREVDDVAGSVESINPLLNQPSGLSTTAVLTMLTARSPESRRELAAEGLSTAYDVEINGRAPILEVTSRARTRELAMSTTLRLIDLIDRDLSARQLGIPADQQVSTNLLKFGSVGGADYGGRTKLRVLAVGFGAGLSVMIALLLDAASRSNKVRPARRDAATNAPVEPRRLLAHAGDGK